MADAPPIIIIAEPDRMISSALRVEFGHVDCAVLIAASSQEAEAFAAQAVANLVVLDVGRMKLAAYGACARIRRCRGYARRPIVLTASDLTGRDKQAAEAAGATLLLPKPYSVNDLVRAVTPYLEAGDPLLTHRAHQAAMAENSREWKRPAGPIYQSAGESGLARNGRVLPIVRGDTVRIPLYRVT